MNAKTYFKTSILLFIALYGVTKAEAQDRLFTYTYQSTVLNKGQRDLESWNTLRAGRENFYLRYDNRTEYEIGLGKNIQTSFYLNLSSETRTISDNTTKSLSTTNETGFSNEWKLKLLDPMANPVGLALYGEVGVSTNEFDLEGKIILDKKIGNFTIAANGVFEHEFGPNYLNNVLVWEKENKVEGYLAFAYAVRPKFNLTIENAFKNVIVNGELEHSALFSGLGFSYVADKFWVNFTAVPQVASFKGETNNNLNLNEYEKVQFRLLFSYML